VSVSPLPVEARMADSKESRPSSNHHESFFARIARWAADWSGSTAAFALAVLLLVVWACTRPLFENFDTWQLVINTATTIITFLMVFLIQRVQNKDSQAIHLKLNELVAAVHGASNRLINVENLTEDELKALHAHFCKLVELAKEDIDLLKSHSVEEAEERHEVKRRGRQETDSLPEPAGNEPPAPPRRKKAK
jgi:low affinity Fe/Cu permease